MSTKRRKHKRKRKLPTPIYAEVASVETVNPIGLHRRYETRISITVPAKLQGLNEGDMIAFVAVEK